MSSSLISSVSTVGEIVAARPLLARVFERLGIDYCCGGKRPLADVCRAKGLDVAAVAAELATADRSSGEPLDVDPATMTLRALADHIEATHHAYLKAELPLLLEKAERVAHKHGWRDARLPQVATTVRALVEEMFSHMAKEERVLFPLVRELEAHGTVTHACGSLAHPIQQMEHEHDSAGAALERLRELTDGFSPDTEACNTHRALLAGLAQLEADLHQHVHKENNVLFPRALALEAQAAS